MKSREFLLSKYFTTIINTFDGLTQFMTCIFGIPKYRSRMMDFIVGK